MRSPIFNWRTSARLTILKHNFRKGFWLGTFALATVMNFACVRSQNHIGSESLFITKASRKKASSKVEAFPYNSGTEREDPSAPVARKMPSQPTDFVASKTTSRNTAKLEEQFPEVGEALLAVKKDPSNPENHFRLAQTYHLCRVYDLALGEYQLALELDPDNPAYFESLGRLWRDSGVYQNGIDSVQKALQLDKDNVEGWNTLGSIYDLLGDHTQAQQAYSRALSINPNLDYVQNNLCSSFLETGEYVKAVSYCEQAVRLNPAFPTAQNNLGIAYGMLGNLTKAYEAFLKASDEASAHNNLGWVLLQKSDLRAASDQFKLAAKLKPHYRMASDNYYSTQSLIFKRDGKTAGKSKGDDQIHRIIGKDTSGSEAGPPDSIYPMTFDLILLPTPLDYQGIITFLYGNQEFLMTTEVSTDMEKRIVLGDDIPARQTILKRN